MNKKDVYKQAIDEIHASDDLKNKTFQYVKSKEKSNKKIVYFRRLIECVAIVVIVFSISSLNRNFFDEQNESEKEITVAETTVEKNTLPRFNSMEELRNVLEENSSTVSKSTTLYDTDIALELETAEDISIESSSNEEIKSETDTAVADTEDSSINYSTTNTQVENVDEADFVKTDGDNIFYLADDVLYIVDSDSLEIISKIEYESDEKSKFNPSEIYINDNKLVVIGNYFEYNLEKSQNSNYDYVGTSRRNMAKTIVYDISDIKNPTIYREVLLDGNYQNSRMIGDCLYFISSKTVDYYNGITDDEILPIVKDTASEDETRTINYSDIAYFEDITTSEYLLVSGFNIENNDEVNVETFFGASDNVYASENNLYIMQTDYSNCETIIYKFNLDNSDVKLQCKQEIQGEVNNQFSVDEYEGNLRIATTYEVIDNSSLNEVDESDEGLDIVTETINENKTNKLYILDENLEEIGRIDNFAKDEEIYSVRFIGKIGYIVTFEEIDPLFIIDLSDPTNPQIKGQLEIPGYSSYLHSYDDNYIIGIGYNTKDNGYGGIKNDNMKMSMFDVSDLENPKEIFSVDIGNSYTYSEITSNHKALLYDKEKDLIGFPITTNGESGFVIYKIDIDNGFEEYATKLSKIKNYSSVRRVIYIEDNLYVISDSNIIEYDLNTMEVKNQLNF